MGILRGDKASSGFASGHVQWLSHFKPVLEQKIKLSVTAESDLFKSAVQAAVKDLQELRARAQGEAVEVLDAHLMLIEDPEVSDRCYEQIQNGYSAAWAYHQIINEYKKMFLSMNDPYMQQRALDLDDISLRILFYIENPGEKYSSGELAAPAVVLAEEITPSQMMSFDRSKVLGLITVLGGAQSHTAILARSMEIPAIISHLGLLAEGNHNCTLDFIIDQQQIQRVWEWAEICTLLKMVNKFLSKLMAALSLIPKKPSLLKNIYKRKKNSKSKKSSTRL